MSFIRTIALAGAFATTISFAANAALTVSYAQVVPDPTVTNLPPGFSIINLGSGGGPGAISTGGAGTQTVVGGLTIDYFGLSGIYAGDVSGVTRSPIRPVGTGNDAHYLNARANNGYIDITLAAPTNNFALLWGSVDTGATYNLVTITAGGAGSVTGSQIITAANPGVTAGTSNIAVVLTSDTAFTTLRFTATQEAFEFIPVSVPEPASLALLGMGLLGLGAAARRRRRA